MKHLVIRKHIAYKYLHFHDWESELNFIFPEVNNCFCRLPANGPQCFLNNPFHFCKWNIYENYFAGLQHVHFSFAAVSVKYYTFDVLAFLFFSCVWWCEKHNTISTIELAHRVKRRRKKMVCSDRWLQHQLNALIKALKLHYIYLYISIYLYIIWRCFNYKILFAMCWSPYSICFTIVKDY